MEIINPDVLTDFDLGADLESLDTQQSCSENCPRLSGGCLSICAPMHTCM